MLVLAYSLTPYFYNLSDSGQNVNHKIKKPRIFILGYFEIDLSFVYVKVARLHQTIRLGDFLSALLCSKV